MNGQTRTGLRGRRVLLVHDDPSAAGRLATRLEAEGAAVVGPVTLLGEAMSLLRSERLPDLAVLDLELGWGAAAPLVAALRSLRIPAICAGAGTGWALGEGCRAVPCGQGAEGQDRLLLALLALSRDC